MIRFLPLMLCAALCAPVRLSSAALGPIVSRPALYALRLTPSWRGLASYYARRFHGRLTASGTVYNQHELTAASNAIPMGRRVRVCRADREWRCVEVEITDTGELYGRLVDLSREAARRLGMMTEGVVNVRVTP